MESGDSCSGLSVTIARRQAAALAENAACYSSVANIGRYQLGSGPAERTSETHLTPRFDTVPSFVRPRRSV